MVKIPLLLLLSACAAGAVEPGGVLANAGLRQVEQYNFSIHILAMLLVGFGFLMVFVRNYGYSALTGTYLVVGAGLPVYLFLRSTGMVSAEAIAPDSIKALLLAEFACAAGLISMGAILGRVRLHQYIILAVLAVLFVVPGQARAQLAGIAITVVLALASGAIAGYIIKAFGAKHLAYEDKDEFAALEANALAFEDKDEFAG